MKLTWERRDNLIMNLINHNFEGYYNELPDYNNLDDGEIMALCIEATDGYDWFTDEEIDEYDNDVSEESELFKELSPDEQAKHLVRYFGGAPRKDI